MTTPAKHRPEDCPRGRCLVLRKEKGVVPPRFVIECVLAEMRAFAGKPATESPLRANCVKKVDALAALTGSEKQAL